ncbi:hypothetical protein [Imtechella halotolerans]|uniref:Uncharacterized protein n=1 Tax=Imtechella halotolerans K1 TaxID=946077 RepID=I0WDZ9_9FLAO|nr:hypothetical protein [Imtechella halotolerans]EID74615.1 hypothetical protein W5A_08792 [Imtechella halotolerans K1]WMQ62463.1 hypothetical protein PT603_08960 [Imtechella halotolerans]
MRTIVSFVFLLIGVVGYSQTGVEAKIVPFDVTITVEQKDKVIAIKKVEVIELLVKKERLPKIKGINVNYLNLLTEVPKYIVSQQA